MKLSLSVFGSSYVSETKRNRETILACESSEGRCCLRAGIERRLKIVGYCRILLTVCGLPASVGLCPINFGLAGRSHAPFVDQSLDVVAIDLRPRAAKTTRRKRLEEKICIIGLFLTIDPAVAQGHVQRFGIGNARLL